MIPSWLKELGATPVHPDEIAFLNKMMEDPEDETTILVYCDWLDEHDRTMVCWKCGGAPEVQCDECENTRILPASKQLREGLELRHTGQDPKALRRKRRIGDHPDPNIGPVSFHTPEDQ